MTVNRNETTTALPAAPTPDDATLSAAGFDRRDFMRVGGTMAAATAIVAAGCSPPAETSRPFHQRPENLNRHGKQKLYATVLDGTPVLVRCREGRPIGIAPNPGSPSKRA